MNRDVLALLADSNVVAVCLDCQRWPRGMLSENAVPDAWMGLVEKRDGRRRFVPAGQEPAVEREDKLTLVRNRPFAVALSLVSAPAKCGKVVSATCEVLLRWDAREDDLAALRRGLLTGESLTLPQLVEAVQQNGGLAALRQLIKTHPAAELVADDRRGELLTCLNEQLKRFLFEVGAQLERVTKLDFSSPMLDRELAVQREAQQRIHDIKSREMVEAAARAAMARRIEDMSGVLEKLRTVAAGDSSLRWHELLPTLSPPERGRLLENLWRISPDRHTTTAIVAVGGDECFWLEPQKPSEIRARRELPADLGGVRSVRHVPERGWLLIGSASGVWVVQEKDGAVVTRCEVPMAGRPKTGFNSACVAGQHLFATHSQLGFWRWGLDGAVKPLPLLQTRDGLPKAIRAAHPVADGRVVYSIDARVQVYDPKTEHVDVLTAVDGVIHCLAVHGNMLAIGTERGTLLRCSLDRADDLWAPYRRNGPLESVQIRSWNDLVELVVPGGDAGILAVYEQENIVARLGAARFPVRQVCASDDVVVGLSDRRDELLVLNGNSTQPAPLEVPLARIMGTSIQDVCLVTQPAAAPSKA